ncbi:MAG: DUF362 domain-containing protein [Firmicutes bacterium]|nr:DUF362 domain-containing protein [Candidatus Colimorpha enterica]
MIDYENAVFCRKCENYDRENVSLAVDRLLAQAGFGSDEIRGKRVVIKPNLLLAYAPEKAATTHPAVVEAVINYVKSYFPASLIIAESPGGTYNESSLRRVYDVTGMTGVSERTGVPLNFGSDSDTLSIPDGENAKSVQAIKPILDSEVIVNVCKAKTHSLAVMTGASKNLFGVIPGITKFEMHARFSDPQKFFGMVTDVNCELKKHRTVFSVCDAVICMEGNGPSGGNPKHAGMLFASRNTFSLDSVLAEMMGVHDETPILAIAASRGLIPASADMIAKVGDPVPTGLDFVKADATQGKKLTKIPAFLQPRPVIDRDICKGCFACVKACPQHTIVEKDGKAFIEKKNCIRCYCCQELCTFKAVRIKKSFIYNIIK